MPYVNQAIDKKQLFSRSGGAWPPRHESIDGVRDPASVKLLMPIGLLIVRPSNRPSASLASNHLILDVPGAGDEVAAGGAGNSAFGGVADDQDARAAAEQGGSNVFNQIAVDQAPRGVPVQADDLFAPDPR